jgi:hypothetical protein
MLEPSWRDDVVIVTSSPLSVVCALDEGLTRPIAGEVDPEHDAVWFTRRDAQRAQGALLLRCTRLRVIADSLLRRDGWCICLAGWNPGFGLGHAWHRVGSPLDH